MAGAVDRPMGPNGPTDVCYEQRMSSSTDSKESFVFVDGIWWVDVYVSPTSH